MKYSNVLAMLALTLSTAMPAFADTVTTTTTTSDGNVVTKFGRFFGNAVMYPFTVFRGSDGAVVSTSSTVGSQPVFISVDRVGQPTLVKEYVAFVPGSTTTTTTVSVVSVEYPMHDDLINRRNDLVARVAVEQARGQLSSSEANGFISRIQNLDNKRIQIRKSEAAGAYVRNDRRTDTLSYYDQVKNLYNDYNHVANDMRDESHQDDKQLAATYSYIAL